MACPLGWWSLVVLLFLGGVSWPSCCLCAWAVCRGLKIGSTHTSFKWRGTQTWGQFSFQNRESRESSQQTHSEAMSEEEGPDYENTRQKYSVYDAMYENWTAVSLCNRNLFFVLFKKKKKKNMIISQHAQPGLGYCRVATCHRYDRYICVKIFAGWVTYSWYQQLAPTGKKGYMG